MNKLYLVCYRTKFSNEILLITVDRKRAEDYKKSIPVNSNHAVIIEEWVNNGKGDFDYERGYD